jgi:polysaccharide export outer membrane protein
MKMKKQKLIMGLMALLMLSSCASRKNFVYLQDLKPDKEYPLEVKHEAKVHRDDRLAITVSCKQPALAIPFNMQGGNFSINPDGHVTNQGSTNSEKGYRVDSDGLIDFPILGKLFVEGKRVSEVKEMIQDKIKEGNYIKDPLVSIEILNFKYTVLGAAGAGTYQVEGDRITLLEAIAKAGDLSTNARVDRVSVIREEDGVRKVYTHDLRTKDVFKSPAYYLQQNDIVYVEPKYKKKDTEDRTIQYSSLLLSILSAVCSVLWWLN